MPAPTPVPVPAFRRGPAPAPDSDEIEGGGGGGARGGGGGPPALTPGFGPPIIWGGGGGGAGGGGGGCRPTAGPAPVVVAPGPAAPPVLLPVSFKLAAPSADTATPAAPPASFCKTWRVRESMSAAPTSPPALADATCSQAAASTQQQACSISLRHCTCYTALSLRQREVLHTNTLPHLSHGFSCPLTSSPPAPCSLYLGHDCLQHLFIQAPCQACHYAPQPSTNTGAVTVGLGPCHRRRRCRFAGSSSGGALWVKEVVVQQLLLGQRHGTMAAVERHSIK